MTAIPSYLKDADSTSNYLCFGDIHGHSAAAEGAIALAETLGVRAIFLGDYVDRGPDSLGVLKVLMEAAERHRDWVFLLGNHDWMLLEILCGRRHDQGFDERTYLETWPTPPGSLHSPVRSWLQALPVFFRCGACLFVHGGFNDAEIPIEQVAPEELLWTYGIPKNWLGETVVRGHTLVDHVECAPRDININTRCGFGGHLTGLLIDTANGTPLQVWQITENGGVHGPADMRILS